MLASAGASLVRDAADTRMIGQLRSLGKQGKIINSEADVSGIGTLVSKPCPTDTDDDGMPDAWEAAHGLNPNDPKDASGISKSGYTHIEEYINSLVPEMPQDKQK